ncbi:MAG: hypothetical protein HYZ42_07250 [Bacteroidetes bacterium]|nr:hypothetical protein [Bacteroidota bacterium]
MNKLTKIFSLGILMFSTVIALSNNTPAKEKGTPENGTEKTIRDFLKFPQVLIPTSQGIINAPQKVEVLFTTDKSGTVNFVLAKTNNISLKAEIEKQFMALHFNNLKSEVVISVTLSFKTI